MRSQEPLARLGPVRLVPIIFGLSDLLFLTEWVLIDALDREPVQIAALSFETDDPYLSGTALEYLETVLPQAIFTALVPRLAAPGARPPCARDAAAARADLLHAGATLKVSLEEMRRQLFRE